MLKKKQLYLKSGFIIEKCKRIKHYTMSVFHYHNTYEIYYLLEGQRYYFIKDRTYLVKKGDIILINKYDIHRTLYASSNEHERILIKFKEDYLAKINKNIVSEYNIFESLQNGPNVLRLSINQQSFIENILSKLLSEYNSNFKESILYTQTLLLELLINLNRYSSKAGNLTYPNPLHKKVSEIVKFINENYYLDLSIELLAEKFSISTSYISKIFKEVTDTTIIQYVNNIRIKEAQKLLRNSTMNVTEISLEVGFNNLTHFGRVFKQKTNLSPLKYRQLSQTEQE